MFYIRYIDNTLLLVKRQDIKSVKQDITSVSS